MSTYLALTCTQGPSCLSSFNILFDHLLLSLSNFCSLVLNLSSLGTPSRSEFLCTHVIQIQGLFLKENEVLKSEVSEVTIVVGSLYQFIVSTMKGRTHWIDISITFHLPCLFCSLLSSSVSLIHLMLSSSHRVVTPLVRSLKCFICYNVCARLTLLTFPEVFFSLWSRKTYPNFSSLGMLDFRLLPELISAILSIYMSLTTSTN